MDEFKIPSNIYDGTLLRNYQLVAFICKLINWMSKHNWYFRKCFEQLYDGKLGMATSDIMYVKPFIYVVAK